MLCVADVQIMFWISSQWTSSNNHVCYLWSKTDKQFLLSFSQIVAYIFSHHNKWNIFSGLLVRFLKREEIGLIYWSSACYICPPDTGGAWRRNQLRDMNCSFTKTALSLFLCWHSTRRASTDWESHMAGNKPRASFMSTLRVAPAPCHLI